MITNVNGGDLSPVRDRRGYKSVILVMIWLHVAAVCSVIGQTVYWMANEPMPNSAVVQRSIDEIIPNARLAGESDRNFSGLQFDGRNIIERLAVGVDEFYPYGTFFDAPVNGSTAINPPAPPKWNKVSRGDENIFTQDNIVVRIPVKADMWGRDAPQSDRILGVVYYSSSAWWYLWAIGLPAAVAILTTVAIARNARFFKKMRASSVTLFSVATVFSVGLLGELVYMLSRESFDRPLLNFTSVMEWPLAVGLLGKLVFVALWVNLALLLVGDRATDA